MEEVASLTSAGLVLAVDDEETWPSGVLSVLSAEFEVLRAYEALASEFALMGTVAYLEAGQPRNQFRDARDSVVRFVDEQVRGTSLVGYHCTRLTVEEIAEVERGGLRPLSTALVIRRLRKLEQAGRIDAETAERLKSENVSGKETRRGRTWFVFTKELLTQEDGVGPLLLHWGGEAVYHLHAEGTHMGARLREIGIACIVEANVLTTQIDTLMPIGERLVNAYLGRRNIRPGSGRHMDGCIREPTKVRRVIRRSDPEFDRLTDCAAWHPQP
jgi:hypothetical protein